VKTLRNSALIQEWGGVGYYPTSGVPFVHVDTGRVRMWPRIARLELAALFPKGQTKYLPLDGKPITPQDYKLAMAKGLPGRNTLIAAARPMPKPAAEPAVQTAAFQPVIQPIFKHDFEPGVGAEPHEGLVNKFPFEVEQKTYPFWDGVVGRAVDATFQGEEEVDGLPTYKFQGTPADAPAELSDIEAAAFTLPFHTGYLAVNRRARLQAGETLLVVGGASAVGTAMIQLGTAAGAVLPPEWRPWQWPLEEHRRWRTVDSRQGWRTPRIDPGPDRDCAGPQQPGRDVPDG